MRIESFWARGFRSLRDVRIEKLGAFNVLYGPNGSGKSNILAAIQAWLRLIPIALAPNVDPALGGSPMSSVEMARRRGHLAYGDALSPLQPHDFGLHSPTRKIMLRGTIVDATFGRAEIQIDVDATGLNLRSLSPTFVQFNDIVLEEGAQLTGAQQASLDSLNAVPWNRKISLIPADRMPRIETAKERPPATEEPVSWYFRRGQLKDALFAAQNSTSAETVRALERFREFMKGPPLYRPAFRATEDPHTGVRDLREWLPPPLSEHEISIDLAGLGVAQVYWILGQAMLSGASAVALEEPEAHLHAPTTGRYLRMLLSRLVHEKHIDQLFIATHSNLFDLDEEGFLDVRLENGETVVTRKSLDEIDRHLYEPGPTLHALEELLSFAPADKVMFRRADGTAITAPEMIKMLRDADPVALEYLRNLHAAAIDVVGLRSRRGSAK